MLASRGMSTLERHKRRSLRETLERRLCPRNPLPLRPHPMNRAVGASFFPHPFFSNICCTKKGLPLNECRKEAAPLSQQGVTFPLLCGICSEWAFKVQQVSPNYSMQCSPHRRHVGSSRQG